MSVTDFSGFFVAQKGQDSNCSLFEPKNKQMLGTDPPPRFWLLYNSWSLIQHAFLYITNTRSARYRSSVLDRERDKFISGKVLANIKDNFRVS